ncbi:ATP-grasp domain-containing protein [Mycoplasmatota bacterium]|nr:ATP-grasp domain-containing protein [Mycoplasmatota bacterium]
MKSIIFIGTQKSGSSREAIKAARRLGYKTVLLTSRINQIRNQEAYPDVSQMVFCNVTDYVDLKRNISELQENGLEIETIISFVDSYVYIASLLADEFGVGCFTSDAIFKMHDKLLSRECIKQTPYVPWYKILKDNYYESVDEIYHRLPLILKKPNSTGSKDVYLVNSVSEYLDRLERLSNGYHDQVIVEQYIKGPQFLVESLVENKEIKIVAIIQQEIYIYSGHSIVTGYQLKLDLDSEFEQSLREAVTEIVMCHGMKNGACHLEMRYVNNQWKLIEINPRISGVAMNEFIFYGLGINLAEQTLNLALKKPLQLTPKYEMYTNAQYLISLLSGKLLKVTGRNEALNKFGVIKVFIKPQRGSTIYTPTSMGYRYAYVIANGQDEHQAKINAKIAASKIKFHILRE